MTHPKKCQCEGCAHNRYRAWALRAARSMRGGGELDYDNHRIVPVRAYFRRPAVMRGQSEAQALARFINRDPAFRKMILRASAALIKAATRKRAA